MEEGHSGETDVEGFNVTVSPTIRLLLFLLCHLFMELGQMVLDLENDASCFGMKINTNQTEVLNCTQASYKYFQRRCLTKLCRMESGNSVAARHTHSAAHSSNRHGGVKFESRSRNYCWFVKGGTSHHYSRCYARLK